MSLVLSDNETMLVDTVRGFLARSSPVSAFRALRDSGDPKLYAPTLWAEMTELGLASLLRSEAEGGGFGFAGAGLVAEQIGAVLAATPFFSALLAIDLLQRVGGDKHAALIDQIADGSLIVAFAYEEQRKHDPDMLRATRVVAQDAGWRLDGTKRLVIDGGIADKFIVAVSADAGPTLLLVDTRTAGVTVTALHLVDRRSAADVQFTGVTLDGSATLGTPGGAEEAISHALDVGRALLAAELLGMAQESFDRTIEYLKQREQFGQKIGSFQALQHRAARLYTRLEIARAVMMKALRSLDENDTGASLLCSLAKMHLTLIARQVLDEAVQMHGGIGVTDDIDIGLFMKRVRTAGEMFGDDRFHKQRLARMALAL